MTLHKQLVAGMIAVIIILLISVSVIEFNTTRNFLEQQQRSEVNNTINTVGLALAPYLQDRDTVAVESVINALFDGSSYSVVRLIFLDTNQEIVRSYPIKPSTVPTWFVGLNLFEPIHDSRVVTSGWMQLAEVEIISHPGGAYQQLWVAFEDLVIAFCIVLLVGLFAISLLLKRALNPLNMIVAKMKQVAQNKFGAPLPLPKTTDLLSVVEGINSMSAQLEATFKAQAKEAQQLRERAYIDPVSSLGNRAYYMNQLNAWLTEGAYGGVALLEARFIKDLYDEKGYEAGDKMVRELADHLKVALNNYDVSLARISSDEFGFIMPHMDEGELKQVAESIIAYVQDLDADPTGMSKANAALGVVHNSRSSSVSNILTLLDNALADATANPELAYSYTTSQDSQTLMGKQQWKLLVEEAINNDWFAFRTQPANASTGQTYHYEMFSAIETGDQRYSANQYLFALEQLNASNVFDEYVITATLEKLKSDTASYDAPIAINIAQNSISQPSFIRWVTQRLNRDKDLAKLIHFEIPENCFINSPHHTALFCNAIRSAGADFGVDNYGRNFQSLDYINEFRPAYVKLDYLYTHHIEDEKQRFTLTSISRTAHNLGIKTIASRVETQAQLDFLSEHFIDIFQGFIVEK